MSGNPPSSAIAAQQAQLRSSLPFDDTQDFDDARRGLIGTLDPVRGPRPTTAGSCGTTTPTASSPATRPTRCNPSLWRQASSDRDPGPLRGRRGHLPGARPRPVEHDARRGRRRASSSSTRCSPRRPAAAALALYRKHRGRPAGHRGDLHPLPRRPLRRRAGGRHPGGGRLRRGPGGRARGLPGARGRGERLRRHRDEPPRRVHVRRRAGPRARGARSAPASGRRLDRRGRRSSRRPSTSPPPARRRSSTGCASCSRWRPGTEAPAEMNFYFPDLTAAVHGGERHPQPAQPPHPARRAGPRPAHLVAVPHRGHRPVRRTGRGGLRLPPLADVGPASGSSSSSPRSATSTPTCTTRRCG